VSTTSQTRMVLISKGVASVRDWIWKDIIVFEGVIGIDGSAQEVEHERENLSTLFQVPKEEAVEKVIDVHLGLWLVINGVGPPAAGWQRRLVSAAWKQQCA
jgi:hypothetical protein